MEHGSKPSSLSALTVFTVLPPEMEWMDSFWSQDPLIRMLSLVSNFCGQNLRHQTGWVDFSMTVSSAPFLSLRRILPLYREIARIWPSGDQSQSRHFCLVKNLLTFCPSVCQRPKSSLVHEARDYSTGLKQRAWTGALCEYFRSPTPSADHTTTLRSAPAEAHLCPSLEYARAYTTSLWARFESITSPEWAS